MTAEAILCAVTIMCVIAVRPQMRGRAATISSMVRATVMRASLPSITRTPTPWVCR